MNGMLYLIPVTLGEAPIEQVIPAYVQQLINRIDHYAVENLRSARRFLKKAGIVKPIDDLHFYLLNKATKEVELSEILHVMKSGKSVGIMSEAGVPAVADPGSGLVDIAHRNNIRVIPLAGPSSILMALMASGMNGQEFHFHGYLPIMKPQRMKVLKQIEKQAGETGSTQIFMETPYRNMGLLEDILNVCEAETRLCIATQISLQGESIRTRSVRDWKKNPPDLRKRPSVFLISRV